jgi:hypothetical protein
MLVSSYEGVEFGQIFLEMMRNSCRMPHPYSYKTTN